MLHNSKFHAAPDNNHAEIDLRVQFSARDYHVAKCTQNLGMKRTKRDGTTKILRRKMTGS